LNSVTAGFALLKKNAWLGTIQIHLC